MSDKEICKECTNPKPMGDGTWQCQLGRCRRIFIPLDVCWACKNKQEEEQEPVKDEE